MRTLETLKYKEKEAPFRTSFMVSPAGFSRSRNGRPVPLERALDFLRANKAGALSPSANSPLG